MIVGSGRATPIIRTVIPKKLTFMSNPPSNSVVTLHPAPLETLVIPAALDGRSGANRATGGVAQIAAANDLDANRAWLERFADKLPQGS